jgi:hypothetical protein
MAPVGGRESASRWHPQVHPEMNTNMSASSRPDNQVRVATDNARRKKRGPEQHPDLSFPDVTQ